MVRRLLGVTVSAAALAAPAAAAGPIVLAPADGGPPLVRLVDANGQMLSQFYAFPSSRAPSVAARGGRLVAGGARDGRPVVELRGRDGAVVQTILAAPPSFGGGVSAAIGDVTGDGAADVVTALGAGGGGEVAVWRVGGGDVARWRTLEPGAPQGVHVAVGDVDGDRIDEVVTSSGPHVEVWSATPSVRRVASLAVGTVTDATEVRVAVGDLDGDGKAEVVVGADGDELPQVQVFDVATGARRAALTPFPTAAGEVRVAVADLDGDGKAEIVAAADGEYWGSVKVLDGAGHERGGWGLPYGAELGVGDADGDGRNEVLASWSDWQGPITAGYDENGGGTWTRRVLVAPATGLRVAEAVVGGNLRLFVGSGPGAAPRVHVFDRDGNAATTLDAFDAVLSPGLQVATGDLDGDGRAELIVAPENASFSSVKVFSLPSFAPRASFDLVPAGSWVSTSLTAAFGNSGRATIVAGVAAASSEVLAYDGAGTRFASFVPGDDADWSGIAVAAGDVNGDGIDDLAVLSRSTGTVRMFANAFGFASGSFPVGGVGYGARIGAADVDGDGRSEILVGASGAVVAYRADGSRVAAWTPFAGYGGAITVATLPRLGTPRRNLPPSRVAVRGPRWTRDRTPVYRFAATDVDGEVTRFRCAFDSARLHTCRARVTPRLGVGRHMLRVRAVDDAGAVGPLATIPIVVAR